MSSSLIELRNINKYYKVEKEKVHILRGINVKINKGEFIVIMGKSGSGKTTLLNILGFLDRFDTGNFIFKGKDVTTLNEKERSRFRNLNIGFVFQQFNLIEGLDIYKNIEIPMLYNKKFLKGEKDEIIKTNLTRVGLLDKIHQRPNELSGGQQQRIAIARALANSPDILFADEPTGALDTNTGIEIMNLLKMLNEKEGKTIIMVTHDPDITKYATRVIYLENGVIVEGGRNGSN